MELKAGEKGGIDIVFGPDEYYVAEGQAVHTNLSAELGAWLLGQLLKFVALDAPSTKH